MNTKHRRSQDAPARVDGGDWKETETFATEAEAKNWVYEKFGKTMGTLSVQSAAGTETGKTKLTVTPNKGESSSYMYKTGVNVSLPGYNDVCNVNSGWTPWDWNSGNRGKDRRQNRSG